MRVQCCVCKKVKSNDAWRDAPKAADFAGMSHTYCPACLDDAVLAILADRRAAAMASGGCLSVVG